MTARYACRKLFADCLYQKGHRVPLSYVFPTLRWITDTPLETPVHDPMVQRIVDHLAAAQVGLLTAADSQENSAMLLEAHEFVWQALTVLSRAAAAKSGPDQEVEGTRVTSQRARPR
jgi:hypothetical protein